MTSPKSCPLCASVQTALHGKGPLNRTFYRCHHCQLLFTSEENQPDRKTEKARYETHNNSPRDDGYVEFLQQAVQPALKFLNPGMHGLDYGCGPGPAISVLLENQGILCDNYDPFFYPALPAGPFDFIFCTETFEHFSYPGEELRTLDQLLKPGAYLTVMTSLWDQSHDFGNWAYARDHTHVCFCHQQTMEYIGRKFGWIIAYNDHNRVVIFQKGH